jgi:hypothetical protein
VELHDCFSANELITYEALGLCPEGKAGEMIDRGDNTYGGKYVVNPSGGLISKGHPLGATGNLYHIILHMCTYFYVPNFVACVRSSVIIDFQIFARSRAVLRVNVAASRPSRQSSSTKLQSRFAAQYWIGRSSSRRFVQDGR